MRYGFQSDCFILLVEGVLIQYLDQALSPTRAGKYLYLSYCTMLLFFFLSSRFLSHRGSDVYQSNQMSLLSLSRKHTLTPSRANYKDLGVKIMNKFKSVTLATPNSQ